MGLVQPVVSGSTTGTSLTLTLTDTVAAYDGVIIAVCGYFGGVISDITIGAVGSTFAKVATSGGYNAEIWANTNVQPADTSDSIVITTTTAGIIAWVYEVNGIPAGAGVDPSVGAVFLDQAAGDYSGTAAATWSSGATAATLPASEFVVGLALALPNNSTTITGPVGWVYESATENVLGAGGDYLSAVSGYQFPPASGTFTYSGTVSPAASWAAVTATFLLMPAEPGWGGYVATNPGGFTSISAAFTVPPLTGQSGSICSVWVGLGNVKQTGVYLYYDTGYSGNTQCFAWTWYLPGDELWNATSYPFAAGDKVTLTLSYDDSFWYAAIANATQDWSYTQKKSVQDAILGDTAPQGWPFPITTAEIIIENEVTNLPDFGSIAFTDVTATPAFDNPNPLATCNADIDQVPGPFSAGSFTMYWNAYS